MNSYFLPNYNTTLFQRLSFPVVPVDSVRHAQAAWEAKTWLGRSVHAMIATAECIPCLGPLLALVERCLAWYCQPRTPSENIKKDYDVKTWEESGLFDNTSELLETDQNDDVPRVEESVLVEDTSELLEADGILVLDQVEVSLPIDLTPPFFGSDEKVEQEASLPLNPDADVLARQKEATYHILATPGFIADVNEDYYHCGSKGEIQGNQTLRHTVAKVTRLFPRAISPEALKEQRDVNVEQYLTIKLKHFAHAFCLKGHVPLPSGNRVDLEGFCEAFTIPMIVTSVHEYAKQATFFSAADYEWIIANFNQTTSSDNTEESDIQKLTRLLQDPNFVGPISLGSGHQWHSTATIFFDKYIIYCNRGNGDDPGIHVYYLPDRSLLTENVIRTMAKRQEVDRTEVFGTKRIVDDLGGELVHYQKLPSQGAGNCTLISMETALYAFMVIRQILNVFGDTCVIPSEVMDGEVWEQLLNTLRPEYENWKTFDRQLIFKDMIEEIQEWMDKTSSFSQHPLSQTYYELLRAWVEHYGDHEPLPDQSLSASVESLLKKLLPERIAELEKNADSSGMLPF